ncbi:MAG TPA: GNAT family protein [Acidimicrobiales bacterium]|jgi:ribosomal-protein-alanine N-acetyltransferase|nr:GNAT family protein [Acidimicrobiales bacterium]
MNVLNGRRVRLRPLVSSDFPTWQEVRRRNAGWLTPWEPARNPNLPDVVESSEAFAMRCSARERERQLGTGFGFGIFVPDAGGPRHGDRFCGEINLSSVQRGPFQSAYVGYWIDQGQAGHGYMPEAVVLLARFAFEQVHLHRIQISIIPRNHRSRRVVEKLKLRDEGVALRYLEINGVWEDHLRYAFTIEEWQDRKDELTREWLA